MASGWFGGGAIELIKARSLLVKVAPTPTSLPERRAVLHALQRHGPIEVFKRLTEPNTFVCATTKTEIANELVKISPITFKYVTEPLQSLREKAAPGAHPISVAAPIEIHEVEGNQSAGHSPGDAQSDDTDTDTDMIKTFTMHINPSQSYYAHRETIRLNPLHGPWPSTRQEDQDFVFSALHNEVPDGMAQRGLCDWYTGGQLSEDAKLLRTSNHAAKFWHIQQRQIRRGKRARADNPLEDELVYWTTLDKTKRRRDEERRRKARKE